MNNKRDIKSLLQQLSGDDDNLLLGSASFNGGAEPNNLLLGSAGVITGIVKPNDLSLGVTRNLKTESSALNFNRGGAEQNNLLLGSALGFTSRICKTNRSPIGFTNIGQICYWNSLMQCLLSCDQFNNKLLKLNTNNPIAIEYLKLINTDNPNQSFNVLKEFMAHLKIKGISFGHSQESVSEGLILFMDYLPKCMYDLMLHRERRFTGCRACKFINPAKFEESIHFIVYDQSIKNTEEFVSYLKGRASFIDDYKCENCGNIGVTQYENLVMIPEIIIILYPIYMKKYNKFIPEYFELNGNKEPLKYEQVGQIRHQGTLHGGHYYAIVKRNGQYYTANDNYVALFPVVVNNSLVYSMNHQQQYNNNLSDSSVYIVFYSNTI